MSIPPLLKRSHPGPWYYKSPGRDLPRWMAPQRTPGGGAPPPVTITIGNANSGTDYTITNISGRFYYDFQATGKTMTLTTSGTLLIDYFGIGGGGGGGANIGGGGGAGGIQQATNYSLPAGTYNINIGAGGTGSYFFFGLTPGTDGGNTTFGSIMTARGGGLGGSANASPSDGFTGGCGGGGAGVVVGNGGSGLQGFAGGKGGTNDAAGGGGTSSAGGNGGSFGTGTGFGGSGTTYIGIQVGGGGGGGVAGGTGGAATFGGGAGGSAGLSGVSGTKNTGGGGGGGANFDGSTGGNGGSGRFIFSYVP